MPQRVVITGMGAISALGLGADPLWRGMLAGRSGIVPLLSPDPTVEIRMKVGAVVPGFDPSLHFDRSRLLLLDRVSQFALVAAREAVAQSGIDFRLDSAGARSCVVVGTGVGGETSRDEQSRRIYRDNAERGILRDLLHDRSVPTRPCTNTQKSLILPDSCITGRMAYLSGQIHDQRMAVGEESQHAGSAGIVVDRGQRKLRAPLAGAEPRGIGVARLCVRDKYGHNGEHDADGNNVGESHDYSSNGGIEFTDRISDDASIFNRVPRSTGQVPCRFYCRRLP